MKITTKHVRNSLVTFVTHERSAVFFFLPSCCVNSLLWAALRHLCIRLAVDEATQGGTQGRNDKAIVKKQEVVTFAHASGLLTVSRKLFWGTFNSIPQGETSPAAKSEEKRMFSQATLSREIFLHTQSTADMYYRHFGQVMLKCHVWEKDHLAG